MLEWPFIRVHSFSVEEARALTRLIVCAVLPESALLAYSKTCVKRPLSKRQKIGFHDQFLLNAGQKYPLEHSAILLTFIKLPFVIKIFVSYF